MIRTSQQKFTASVGAIVTDSKGRILLLEHHLRPAAGWGIPGGFLEAGEQPLEAVRREIMEETGLEIEEVEMVRIRTTARHLEILFRARATGSARVVSPEINALGWFLPDEMPGNLSPSQRSVIEQVLRDRI